MRKMRIGRAIALVCSGAVLLQAGGCVSALAPLALSLGEDLLLTLLLGGLGL
jgi:hypothetical protein